ncbi:AAA family ATPase [Virgibacillus sp. AGTR]|uniref:AAA family ATPase n=1 Tax=Virgibacillus sp. AGTR TaxID=2812055 RepID=UPI001D16DC84|nr:AAA family ATPase [Virgibacillus sp. AGTR]MCC2248953.1 AAA family ATPase [Virgibacillus sp. AGTR]
MKSALTFAQVKPFIEADLKAGQTPALMGEPGIGKSSLIEDLSRTFKTAVFTLPVNQLADRADLTGVRMTQSENGTWRQEAFPHSTIMEAIEYAADHPDENPILFLDEFNRASSDITSSILSFQTLRRIGTINFPDNLRLIVAGNDKGNVTSLDQASISRFSVYHVRPDLDTFLSIQSLNPFITDVLTKHPEDLMALEAIENSSQDSADDDDDEDSESEDYAFSQFEFLAEDTFTQITRPRTITYASEWLNNMGLDKSGSDKEHELLGQLFADMTESDESNILFAGIEAHVGNTTFAHHLFDEINTHFNSMLSATHVSNQPVLKDLRPKQDIINTMSRAANVQDVEQLIDAMDEKDRLNTLVWLTEISSTKEINNNQAVTAFMSNAPHHITQFDNKAIQNLMKVLPDSAKVAENAVQSMLSSTAPVMNQWKGMIQSVMEQD